MKYLLILFMLTSFAYGQKSYYTIANCVIASANGKMDTVFNAKEGNIYCVMDLDSMKISFDWKTKEFNTIKIYKIIEKKEVKADDYYTMGVYAMKLKCQNRAGKSCNIDFALNSRINSIRIVVSDGENVLFYDAIQTK